MLYIEPIAGPGPFVHFIEEARGPIDINVYYLNSRLILRAVAAARRRREPVNVIIDGRPYRMSHRLVTKEIARIKATGAKVKAAPPRFDRAFRFDHAKYAVTTGKALIGTANWDYSAFHRNREYVLTTSDPPLVRALHIVFQDDWHKRQVGAWAREIAPRLVLSPGSKSKVVAVLCQPGRIEMETEEMGSDPALLRELERKGADAKVIVPGRQSRRDARNVDRLRHAGVQVRELPVRPIYMHAKMIVGDRVGFIGSENTSTASLNHNREVGVILDKPAQLARLRHWFALDWGAARRP
ncbi:phospholipase D-like domain-containing protein [Acidiphilium sp.]|uniref:phospholipase D-like domain-containing protein n=2 Tax=Acidiphilium sp. TaxID=527 RepID=UPI002588064C|nr:phospholipase D-like domain-containing protein [Acidiphilium sp.]